MKTPDRILVSVPNWVGDAVMATAALAAIRRTYRNARITHLMRPYVADVLRGAGLCDEVVFWPDANRGRSGPRSTTALIRGLRRERFDLAVLFTNSFRSALVARLAGAARRVGYARDARAWLLNDRLTPLRRNGDYVPVPALDYYNEIARHLRCEGVGDRLLLATTPEDEAALDERLGPMDSARPLVVLNPGANYGSAKCWPAAHYAALSDALVDRYNARVAASLSPKERRIADELSAAARRPLEIFVDPSLGLGPLKALVRRSDLLITNDTGPRHFAAAFDVPCITIFGSSDPAWTDTRFARERIVKLDLDCQPCMKRVCPLRHHHCMRLLSPEQVLEAASAFLDGRREPAAVRGKVPVSPGAV